MSNGNEPLTTGIGIKELSERGMKIYNSLVQDKTIVESELQGKVVTIEVESKKHYIGDSVKDSYELAHKEHPNSVFHFVNVGSSNKHFRAGEANYEWSF